MPRLHLHHLNRPVRVATAVVLLVATATACTSSSSKSSMPTTLGTHVAAVTAAQLTKDVDALYKSHPNVAAFTSQDVTYTPTTRDKVLQVCTKGGQAADAQTQESNRVFACGPLIFFFWSYSKQAKVKQSFDVADDIFSYAATQISGPFNAANTLGGLLRGWGLPVSATATSTKAATGSATSPETSLISQVKAAMLAAQGVHVVITESKTDPKTSATVTADVGTNTADQTLVSASASAKLKLTPTAGYVSGNSAGLTSFYGLSPANVKAIGSKWVTFAKGSGEYTDFVQENTIASLPSSTLPDSSTTTQVDTDTVNGVLVYVLTWSTTADGSTTTVDFTLDVTATGEPLPVKETSTGGGTTETSTYSKWGEAVVVTAPTPTIPFTSLGAK